MSAIAVIFTFEEFGRRFDRRQGTSRVLHPRWRYYYCATPQVALPLLCYTLGGATIIVLHPRWRYHYCATSYMALPLLCCTLGGATIIVLHPRWRYHYCATPQVALPLLCYILGGVHGYQPHSAFMATNLTLPSWLPTSQCLHGYQPHSAFMATNLAVWLPTSQCLHGYQPHNAAWQQKTGIPELFHTQLYFEPRKNGVFTSAQQHLIL
ncbi:hypothetical protein EGW08_017167 [Elysia chlorotica]|uniref:Uncharacterized protein n=1 Tax=Elysia chlorotica TaxID=188477 RepID=A0A3S1BUB4_ELYCH|nr:hypothetical protein EGW08_017167 [Elysia chlorotica]